MDGKQTLVFLTHFESAAIQAHSDRLKAKSGSRRS